MENEKTRIKALLGDKQYKKVYKYMVKEISKGGDMQKMESELYKMCKKSPGDMAYYNQLQSVIFQETLASG